ncbi:MAG TPA: hypothetical protein VFK17_04030 [Gaiellaceae bacterium]|jgi:hypothetical protein|nr:hypothetical protein [Gaiellaceae bacterium]
MIRKLAATVTAILTGSLAIASTAFARLTVEVGSSSTSTTTGGGFPWDDVAIGVAVGAVALACIAAVALLGRSRRSTAALQA